MPVIEFPSGEELAEGSGDYKLLPEDDYVLEIASVEVRKDQKNLYRPDDPPHDAWLVRFKAIKFADGAPIVYDDGTEPETDRGATVVAFIDPSRMGLVPRASRARLFLAAALNVDIEGRISLETLDDLVGKRLIGRIEHKRNQRGEVHDRLVDYRPIRNRPARRAAAAEQPAADPKAQAEDLIATQVADVFKDEIVEF